jgi:hypothetical protein
VILLHWVAPFSHTAIGLPYLQVWNLRIGIVLKHIWTAVDTVT